MIRISCIRLHARTLRIYPLTPNTKCANDDATTCALSAQMRTNAHKCVAVVAVVASAVHLLFARLLRRLSCRRNPPHWFVPIDMQLTQKC